MRWDDTLEQAAADTLSEEQKNMIREAAFLEETSDTQLAALVARELEAETGASPLAAAAVREVNKLMVADIVCSIDTLEIPSPCCSHKITVRSRGRLIGAGSPGEEFSEQALHTCPSCQRSFDITIVSVCRNENTVSREIEFALVPETFTYHVSGHHSGRSYSGQSFWRPRADGTPVRPRRRITVNA